MSNKTDILVVGGGGREHAIIRALKRSPRLGKIYCAPGNGGISADAQCFPVGATDIEGMTELAKKLAVDCVFVAPDDPLALGMVDALNACGIRAFGPNKDAAIIESSKAFSKDLMKKYGIPTAAYELFTDMQEALRYIAAYEKFPVVVKADGLALGKGVIIAQTREEAEEAVRSMMEDHVFGKSGERIVIEQFLTGPEVSVLAFTDGETVCPMVSSMDHKAVYDGNKGPNTGGMGTISPNPFYTDEIAQQCMEEIFLPTIKAMKAENRPFKGCLYFGLMLTPDGPKVIEYNCRFGDPETQVVLPRLKTDFIDIIDAIIDGKLGELELQWSDDACACVVMASGGYPGSYCKGIEINGLDENGQVEGAYVFHAGTRLEDGKYLTNGGRVLGVTASGATLDEAIDTAYEAVKRITFNGEQHRSDIGRAWKRD
ncbi:MAG: phosphoribosylamine--glycine ligase [Ruminococcaceae bacterium]|nr:phosphoribosylamine--glycine ligase [Oscillospiraceae bacterium]